MVSTRINSKVHWNYFLALERDLEVASRYVEFCDANMRTYSIEFAHLLLAAASEIDVLAKLLCKQLDINAPRRNIDEYRSVLTLHLRDLTTLEVFVPRYGLSFTPWKTWAGEQSPSWWRSYNNVKHERDSYFDQATLENALNALAGLHCLVFYYYDLDLKQSNPSVTNRDTTLTLRPEASLMQFDDAFYYAALIDA